MSIRNIFAATALALAATGCGTIAERLADAIEPRIEQIVDAQIEREERAAGIWGTTNSYFWASREAEMVQTEERREDLMAAVTKLLAENQDTILKEAEKLVDKKLKGGK